MAILEGAGLTSFLRRHQASMVDTVTTRHPFNCWNRDPAIREPAQASIGYAESAFENLVGYPAWLCHSPG